MSQGRGCDASAPHPLPCKCLAKAGGGGNSPRLRLLGLLWAKWKFGGLNVSQIKLSGPKEEEKL